MKEIIKKLIPCFLISWYHLLLAFFGALLFFFPSFDKKIKVIGVTGTNGKSTVVQMATEILEQAGYKVCSISSIKFKMGKKEWPNTLKMTMPGRFKIQRFLRKAVSNGCQYAVLEATSQGIAQHRHRFIDFDVALITNLTPEHIESHGGFENYRKAKGILFKAVEGIHIINLDDQNAEYFLKFPAKKKYGYTMEGKKHEGVEVISDNGKKLNLNLLGKFNISNALGAICIGLSQGVSLENCMRALEKIKGVPGRMEVIIKDPFKVIVDYAHTPDALEKAYRSARGEGRMICVLGSCGGGRDKWKRSELGKIAGQYCDKIILTNEDPYNENEEEILNQIEKGVGRETTKILDRKQAIKKAIQSAKHGDTVIITGKGSEPWMCVANGKKIPWDDRKIAKEEIERAMNS